jgi:PilZ domain
MITENEVPKRRYVRVNLPKGLLVAWQVGGKRTASPAQTLGLGGIYIRTKQPPAVGSILQLIFDSPEGEVRARAEVRSVDEGRGMGVAFVGMDNSGRARLNNFLRRINV